VKTIKLPYSLLTYFKSEYCIALKSQVQSTTNHVQSATSVVGRITLAAMHIISKTRCQPIHRHIQYRPT